MCVHTNTRSIIIDIASWGTHHQVVLFITSDTRYAVGRSVYVHRRLAHPVVHQMSLHPDDHQWATGGPPDVATSSGPPDVALAVGTRMLACGCNADADIKWPTGCTHPVVHPMCTHAVVHRMRTSTGHEDVRC